MNQVYLCVRWYFLIFKLVDSKGGRGGVYKYCTLPILSSTSISALLSPDCLISSYQKLVEKVQNQIEKFCVMLKK